MTKHLTAALVTIAMVTGPAPAAYADGGDAIAGFIVGLGIGAAAASGQKQKHKSSNGSRKKPASSAKRGDAQVQLALNYYNFEAGTPDGLFGPSTRAAIRRYQTYIGEPATGELTAAQTSVLLSAYARDTAGATNPFTSTPGPTGPAAGSGSGQMSALMASLGSQTATGLAPAAQPAVAGAAPAALPTTTTEAAAPTPAALCTQSAGSGAAKGLVAETSPLDPIVNSYCSAVGYAVQNSVELTKAVAGFDPAVSGKQCDDWLAANRATVDSALTKTPEEAAKALAALVPGADATQQKAMRDSFSICHGIAEAAGKPEDARAYAALVAAFGGAGYGELVAASAALGMGAAQSREQANAWYLWTAEGLDGGGAPLITAADYDHVPLLLAMADSAMEAQTDWKGYLAAKAAPAAAPAPAGGLALPGAAAAPAGGLALPGAAPLPATTASATESALPANFEQIYGMTQVQALAACRTGGEAIADLGRKTCRTLAAEAGDAQLAAQYQ
jgi:peptidoglycan hydrolase-like protein with peptidoglycan-binding domain